jgi:hypothetical protein
VLVGPVASATGGGKQELHLLEGRPVHQRFMTSDDALARVLHYPHVVGVGEDLVYRRTRQRPSALLRRWAGDQSARA